MEKFNVGEIIFVSNGATKMKERIFVGGNESYVVCVHKEDEEKYYNGEYFRVGKWSIAKKDQFKIGEEVMVSNKGRDWSKRIYLGMVDGSILAVHNGDYHNFLRGEKTFRTAYWAKAKTV